MARDWEQVTGQPAPGSRKDPPPRTRRVLRRGPRIQGARRPLARTDRGTGTPEAAAPVGVLAEWHALTPGGQTATWAVLRAWVTWLYDRYELSVEDRLPRCWPKHTGLVEELAALKAWREEIYASGQPSGQAARYWHSELRQVLHAATTQYALGCRTGHRAVAPLAADDTELLGTWAAADPLARIAGTEFRAGAAPAPDSFATAAAMGTALDVGDAVSLPGRRDTVLYRGAWWEPTSAGWVRVPRPERPPLPGGPQSPWQGPSEGAAAERGTDPWQA